MEMQLIKQKIDSEKCDKTFQLTLALNYHLEAESLNNEENIGNVTVTRKLQTLFGLLNAISSNSFTNRFKKHLIKLALDNNLPLCTTCQIYSPMKNGYFFNPSDKEDDHLSEAGKRTKHCFVCDVTGFMNAGSKNNEKRQRVLNFSWGLAKIGESNDFLTHNRIDPTSEGGKRKELKNNQNQNNQNNENNEVDNDTESENLANTNEKQNAQMIYHKPVRSGIYSFLIDIDLARIGFDDEKQMYTIEPEQIKLRQQLTLEALRKVFLEITATSAIQPHIIGISGMLMEKTSENDRIGKISSLVENYIEENKRLSTKYVVFQNPTEFQEAIDLYKNDDEFLDAVNQRNLKNWVEIKEKYEQVLNEGRKKKESEDENKEDKEDKEKEEVEKETTTRKRRGRKKADEGKESAESTTE